MATRQAGRSDRALTKDGKLFWGSTATAISIFPTLTSDRDQLSCEAAAAVGATEHW